jgi:spermidine synthase
VHRVKPVLRAPLLPIPPHVRVRTRSAARLPLASGARSGSRGAVRPGVLVLLAGLAAALVFLFMAGRTTVVLESDSDFGTVRVTERADGLRTLYIGGGRARQSAIYPGRPMHLELAYTRVGAVGLALVPPDGRILFVGLGGGAMPMYARQLLPDARIDVVEINPVVVDVAQRYFGFEPDQRMTVHTDDGRAFIEAAPPGSWDLVVLDAFSDSEIPMALATRQFLEAVRSRLTAEGVVASNVHTSAPEYPSMLATYDAVFDQLRLLRVARRQQQIVLAAPAGVRLDREGLVEAAEALAGRVELGFDLAGLVRGGYVDPPPASAPVLDDSLIGDRP